MGKNYRGGVASGARGAAAAEPLHALSPFPPQSSFISSHFYIARCHQDDFFDQCNELANVSRLKISSLGERRDTILPRTPPKQRRLQSFVLRPSMCHRQNIKPIQRNATNGG